jgi:hypothetical protein
MAGQSPDTVRRGHSETHGISSFFPSTGIVFLSLLSEHSAGGKIFLGVMKTFIKNGTGERQK